MPQSLLALRQIVAVCSTTLRETEQRAAVLVIIALSWAMMKPLTTSCSFRGALALALALALEFRQAQGRG